MKKNISDYLPEVNDDDIVLMQAKVKRSLYEQFKPFLKAEGQTTKAFMEACMMKFIDEKKRRAVS